MQIKKSDLPKWAEYLYIDEYEAGVSDSLPLIENGIVWLDWDGIAEWQRVGDGQVATPRFWDLDNFADDYVFELDELDSIPFAEFN